MENEQEARIGNFSIPSSSTLDLTDSLRYTAVDLVKAELHDGYTLQSPSGHYKVVVYIRTDENQLYPCRISICEQWDSDKETKTESETKPETVVNETIKNLDAIIDELKNQAKAGNCKTCQWCIPHGDLSEYHITHLCAIQGNVNPIDFTKAALDSEPYPFGPCDDGNWSERDDNGNQTENIPGCFAYKLKTVDGTQYGDESVQKHWKFMSALAEAARLRNAAGDVEKGKLNDLLMKVVNELNFGKYYVTQEAIDGNCLDDEATAELWAKSEVRYCVDLIWNNFQEYGKTTFSLFRSYDDMSEEEVQSLIVLKHGKTIEDFRHDYAWTIAEQSFSKKQAQLLYKHFSTFANLELKLRRAYVPRNNAIGYSGKAVGGVDDFYAFYKVQGYDLPFKIEGYFRRDENDNSNTNNEPKGLIPDDTIEPDDIPF